MTPGRRAPATRPPRRAGWLAAGLAASVGLHVAALAALLLWAGNGPEEVPGDGASVALVFADTVALAGGGDADPSELPPAPREPPAVAPPAEPAVIPPPPVPEHLAALAPPAGAPPPPPPREPAQAVAVPPPIPASPPAPIAVAEPVAEAAPVPPPAEAPAPQAEAPPADPMPTPPPFESRPVAVAALPERAAAPPPRAAARPRAAPDPVRLGAGAGALPDPSLGARATGAVVPPGAADGYRNAPPDYPPDSRRRGEEGVVRLSLSIGIDGRVTEASVAISSGHAALDAAAIAAARRWRFRPATQAGLPVAATLATAVHFRLTEGERR